MKCECGTCASCEINRLIAIRDAKIDAALELSKRRGPDVEGWDVVYRMVKALTGGRE